MPGPGRKKEKKGFVKKAIGSHSVPGEILGDIDGVGWNLVIQILSQHFDLPGAWNSEFTYSKCIYLA
jgi:hypothetical protein